MSAGRGGAGEGIELLQTGVLSERAAALLAMGPLSTETLAARVLGLRGNASAAAAAIWTLLAGDPRFTVTAEGVWSLRAPLAAAGRRLIEEDWVVVDVETTGGTPASGHRVTEVAAVCVSGGEVREVFSTLVNPRRRIPAMIAALTGITNEMVSEAPLFREIAPRLAEVLHGRVFVAHNAGFDWRFVCAEMELAERRTLNGRQLCTVRLARKLLPQLESRSLGAVAHYFGLEIASRHRARDDAVATAQLLLRFVDMLGDRGIDDWAGLQALLAARAPRRRRRARSPRWMDSA